MRILKALLSTHVSWMSSTELDCELHLPPTIIFLGGRICEAFGKEHHANIFGGTILNQRKSKVGVRNFWEECFGLFSFILCARWPRCFLRHNLHGFGTIKSFCSPYLQPAQHSISKWRSVSWAGNVKEQGLRRPAEVILSFSQWKAIAVDVDGHTNFM